MKYLTLSLMVAGFGLAMVQNITAADKITHEQIEEVMKKGFKAKLHEDLAANKAVLAKYASWLASYKPPKGDAESWKKKTAAITAAINGGLQVVIANQCINGAVNMNVYSKGRRQQELGLLGQGGTSTPEAVVVKTHWSLSQGRDLAADLDSNLIGENPDRIMS